MIDREMNLLPLERRKLLARQFVMDSVSKFLQSVVVSLSILAVVGIALIIGLESLGRIRSVPENVQLTQKIEEYQSLRTDVVRLNRLLTEMEEIHDDKIFWAETVRSVTEALPLGMQISSIIGVVDSRTFTMQGTAPSRNSLVAAEERLSELPWVSGVQSPPSNLLNRINPNFSFVLQLEGGEEEEDDLSLIGE